MDKLLIIDDDTDIQRSFRRLFAGDELEVHTAGSGEEGLKTIPRLRPDVVIMDVRMGGLDGLETLRRIRQADPRQPVIMMTAYGTTQTAIEAMKLGAFDYLLKPFDIPKLKELVAGALRAARQMRTVVAVQPQLASADLELGIVGRSPAMQTVFKLVGQLAASDATALITGESGTGKELVARAIYSNGARAAQPFVAVNCAAIPEALLETELFGHERGAFTGATQQRIGKFEQCDRGTIFLDEIGDMPLATQTKILRVLQSGTFERVGGNETVRVDVRVIAATNKPLEQAVAARTFREDLFYRLNVVRVPLPPLRERREDIPLLVEYFLRRFARESNRPPKAVVPDVLRALQEYPWPGNVRELENVIRRGTVVATGDALLLRDLPPEIDRALRAPAFESTASFPRPGSGLPVAGRAASWRRARPGPGRGRSREVHRLCRSPPCRASEPERQPTLPAGSASTPDSPGVFGEGADGRGDEDISALAQALFQWARRQKGLKVLPAVERELVSEALRETRGNQVQAARLLGITRATLRKRIDKFGIRREFNVS